MADKFFQIGNRKLVEDRFMQRNFLGALILVVVMFIMVGAAWSFLPQEVPLFFSKPWGDSRLAATPYLLLLPGLSFGIVVVNLFGSNFFHEENEMLGKGLAVVSFVFAIMCTVSLAQILRTIL